MMKNNAIPALSWHDEQALRNMTQFQTLPGVRTICVTGGAGFIGSWFLRSMAFAYPDYNFVCLDIFQSCASENNLRALDELPNFTISRTDIRDINEVKKCFKQHSVDVVFHFAAQSHVDLSFDSAATFCETNITGTVTLLEAAREYGIKRFIHVSTDEVYGEVVDGGADHLETAPLNPTNPYSGSKAAAEMMQQCLRAQPIPREIIPKFMSLILRGEKVPLYGNGTYTRRYVYAGDVANAFNVIMHKGAVGQTYNIGSYDEISNTEIVQRIVRAIETDGRHHRRSTEEPDLRRWTYQTPDRPFMDQRYGVDFSKLRMLGWSPTTSFEDGLRRTAEWYRNFGESWWGDISSHLGAGRFGARSQKNSIEPVQHAIQNSRNGKKAEQNGTS